MKLKKKLGFGWKSGAFSMLGLSLITVFAMDVLAQGKGQSATEKSEMSMSCPMMAGLKGIKLHADSPPLLMAKAQELNLTEDQQQKLKKIDEEARQRAREVLSAGQREQLGEVTDEAMSMMDIAMKRARSMDQESSKMMCPMCMKRMKGKMSDMKAKMDKKSGESGKE